MIQMTNKEAINELKERYLGISAYANKEQCQNANKALDIAISALEKQIPKKPIIWEYHTIESPIPNDDWGYECPCCGNRDIDYPEHHCECGQALDWSDEE